MLSWIYQKKTPLLVRALPCYEYKPGVVLNLTVTAVSTSGFTLIHRNQGLGKRLAGHLQVKYYHATRADSLLQYFCSAMVLSSMR
jgi:hypothetical protein